MNTSFIIPSYNSSQTLEESIDSIFNGNFEKDDEVIIVNDCSTDDSLDIANRLANKYYPNITVINNNENKGCPASRNIGIKKSKNTLILNLDSDNILMPGMVSKLKKSLISENADISAFSEYHYFKDGTKKITHKWQCKTGLFSLADILSGMINPAPGGNFLYKKSTWEKIGGYWEYGKGLHEAWGFSLKMLANNAKFIVVPNTYYLHRYSHQSLFIRESKKTNESIRVTNLFIEPILHQLSKDSLDYIKANPDWYNSLNKTPLKLKEWEVGNNGKLIYTSRVKQFLNTIRKFLTK